MIDSISGILMHKDPAHAILDVGGIRMKIHISVNTYERLPGTGSRAELLTYLHVREDILDLYGFGNTEQRDLFMMLIGVSGIGPRTAMGFLSGVSTAEFKKRIIASNVKSLTVIPGIGIKTAKRIIVELKEKFVKEQDEDLPGFVKGDQIPDEINDAIQALLALGYTHSQAYRGLKRLEKAGDLSGGLETIIKKVLSRM